jgi:Tfp pilus assembly protein PilV
METMDQRTRRARREAGFTLLEVIASLLILMFAVLIAANALIALAGLSHSMAVRQELYRISENVIESVRGGLIPMTSGSKDLTGPLAPRNGLKVHTFVQVTELETAGLYGVEVRSSSTLAGRRVEVEIATMVWRP